MFSYTLVLFFITISPFFTLVYNFEVFFSSMYASTKNFSIST